MRARQRSRTALRAFTRDLIPGFGEVGIDRFQSSITGTWRTGMGAHAEAMTADQYFEVLSTAPPEVDWFRVPERRRDGLVIKTRSGMTSTLGELKIAVGGRRSNDGKLFVQLTGNPTRTLSHLLADLGNGGEFRQQVAALDPFSFFAFAENPIPRALGSPDNWLSDADQVQRCLGPDAFSAFLPIYVDQLQALIARLMAPSLATIPAAEGGDIVMSEPGIEVRLRWSELRVPQIEAYFERHHAQAVGGVRTAAMVALGDLDRVDVRRFPRLTSDWVDRLDDCLSISFPLNDRYRMAIYAKSPLRIRFEVRRLGKGDYSGLDRPTSPPDRLLAIMNMERHHLLSASRWSDVGSMFDEHPMPRIGDMSRLCGLVAQACIACGVDVMPVLTRLLEDGGISSNGHDKVPETLINALCRVGVLQRVAPQRRDHRRPVKRYALKAEYRMLIDAVTVAFGNERPTA